MTDLTDRQRQILRDMAERGGVIYFPHYVQITGQTRMLFPDVPVEIDDLRVIFNDGLIEIDDAESNVTGKRFRITDAGRSVERVR